MAAIVGVIGNISDDENKEDDEISAAATVTTVSTENETTERVTETEQIVTTLAEETTVIETTTPEITTTPEVTTTLIQTTVAEIIEETTIAEYSTSEIASLLETISSSSFENVSVNYDAASDTYVCKITQEGLALAYMQVAIGTVQKSSWDNMVESIQEYCKSMHTSIQQLGSTSNVGVFVMNDENPDNVLVSIVNGEVISNVADE